MKDLSALRIGEKGRVAGLDAGGGMGRRLMDLGFTLGAEVECVLTAPGGGMRAYGVRRTVVALRQEDARKVTLEEKRYA